jgi:hypothetical protein
MEFHDIAEQLALQFWPRHLQIPRDLLFNFYLLRSEDPRPPLAQRVMRGCSLKDSQAELGGLTLAICPILTAIVQKLSQSTNPALWAIVQFLKHLLNSLVQQLPGLSNSPAINFQQSFSDLQILLVPDPTQSIGIDSSGGVIEMGERLLTG